MCAQSLSRVLLFATQWTVAHQAPLSMEFSRQEYWSRFPFPGLGDLPDPANEPASPALAGGFFFSFFFTTKTPGKPYTLYRVEQMYNDIYIRISPCSVN